MRYSKLAMPLILTTLIVIQSGCQKPRMCSGPDIQAPAGAPTIDWDEYNSVEAIVSGLYGFDYTPLIGKGNPYPNYDFEGNEIKVTGWIRGGEFAYRTYDGKFILTDLPSDTLHAGAPRHTHITIRLDWQVESDTAIYNAIRERLRSALSHKCYIKGTLGLGHAGNNPNCRSVTPVINIKDVNDFQYEE